MSEWQAEAGPEPDAPTDPVQGRRAGVDGTALLLAVERVGADIAALTRLMAAQPAEVAAHIDIDTATAAITVRVSALGSLLDQLRLSLLAGLDRAAERLDQPVWLPQLQASLDDLAPTAPPADEVGPTLAELVATVAGLADGVRAGAAVAGALEHVGGRLAAIEADGARADAAVADALEHVGGRLAAIEAAAAQVAGDARLLVDRVTPLPDRLGAIAAQMDRMTPLARAGDEVGSLLGQLDRVGGGLEVVLARLSADATPAAPVPPAPTRPPAAGEDGGDTEDDRFEAVVDVLAGVTRRQDEVSAAIASVLDQVRGPMGVDAVLDRMEQRERSLAARLDRIDTELRRRSEGNGASTAGSPPRPDPETVLALRAVHELVERQERTVAARLDRLDAQLHAIADAVPAADAQAEQGASARSLEPVLNRIEQQELAVAARLDGLDARLHVIADGVPAAASQGAQLESARTLEAVLKRLEQQERTIASNLEWVGSRLAEVAAHLVPAEAPEPVAAPEPDERMNAVVQVLAGMDRRQDELLAVVSGMLEQVPTGQASADALEAVEQRDRYLETRFDRIEAELRQDRASAELDDEGSRSLLAAVHSIAVNTANLARLVESTSERLELRLAAVEESLESAARAASQPRSPSEAELAALRLAELRAERAHIQARLQEERLLAAQGYDNTYDDQA